MVSRMKRKNERPPRHRVYDTRMADFFTRTGWMCRKKLVSAVRAATLSVVGRPWRKIDPQIWPRNFLVTSIGFGLVSALTSNPQCLAIVGAARVRREAPLRGFGDPRAAL